MNDSSKNYKLWIAIGIAAVLVVCFFIPYSHWDTKIISGRLISEGSIVKRDREDGTITVRLYVATASDDKIESDTFVTLEGSIPSDAYLGQDVRIGYSSSKGLYGNTDQMVQVSYYVKDNLLVGFVLKTIIPFQTAETDCQIVGIQAGEMKLVYNRAA